MITQPTYLELLSNEQSMEIHGRLAHVSRAGSEEVRWGSNIKKPFDKLRVFYVTLQGVLSKPL